MLGQRAERCGNRIHKWKRIAHQSPRPLVRVYMRKQKNTIDSIDINAIGHSDTTPKVTELWSANLFCRHSPKYKIPGSVHTQLCERELFLLYRLSFFLALSQKGIRNMYINKGKDCWSFHVSHQSSQSFAMLKVYRQRTRTNSTALTQSIRFFQTIRLISSSTWCRSSLFIVQEFSRI